MYYLNTPKPGTIQWVKYWHKAAGGRWFSPSVQSKYGTTFSKSVYPIKNGAYFISCEQPSLMLSTGLVKEPKRYTVQFFDRGTGQIKAASGFMQFETLQQAKTAAQLMKTNHGALV